MTIRIEGNADERGTREYNLALGARRAESVRTYLVERGVNAGRIDTISYGKERPIAQAASNEEALRPQPQRPYRHRRRRNVIRRDVTTSGALARRAPLFVPRRPCEGPETMKILRP
jgi:outer membrane protein OmpA-like peptidoglycan-associated protein